MVADVHTAFRAGAKNDLGAFNRAGEISGLIIPEPLRTPFWDEVLTRIFEHHDRTEKELYVMAHTDALTGLPNRRACDAVLSRGIENVHSTTYPANSRRRNPSSIVIFFDVNDLKEINSPPMGHHDAGDHALKTAAEILKTQFRAPDFVARWGGDEFIAVLTDVSLETAKKRAKDACAAVKEACCEYTHSNHEKIQIPLTLSFGLRPIRSTDTLESLTKDLSDKMHAHKSATKRPRTLLQYATEGRGAMRE